MKAGKGDAVPPMIDRFSNRPAQDRVIRAKKQLRQDTTSRIYISEQLTKMASELFYEAQKFRREKKLESTWTQNGQVFVRQSTDPNIKPTLIRCRADLIRLP